MIPIFNPPTIHPAPGPLPKTGGGQGFTRLGFHLPGLLLTGFLLAALAFGLALPAQAQAEPNRYEVEAIREEALATFLRIVDQWREELFFDIYDSGWADSHARISKEDFAQRMVELTWIPLDKPEPKYLKVEFRYRTLVYVSARITFKNKFNPDNTNTGDFRFIMLKEEGRWRVDLVQLLRMPY